MRFLRRKRLERTIKNTRTGKKIVLPQPLDEEVRFDGGVMITETDRAGIITYANRKFCEFSGYSKEELLGSLHSISRHPHMPGQCFRTLWETVKRGETWEGYIKNLRKDGRYYWVVVWVKPKLDENGGVIGYIAGRKVPDRVMIPRMEHEYTELRGIE